MGGKACKYSTSFIDAPVVGGDPAEGSYGRRRPRQTKGTCSTRPAAGSLHEEGIGGTLPCTGPDGALRPDVRAHPRPGLCLSFRGGVDSPEGIVGVGKGDGRGVRRGIPGILRIDPSPRTVYNWGTRTTTSLTVSTPILGRNIDKKEGT